MTRDPLPAAYWRRVNDALFEAGEAQLASSRTDVFFNSGPGCDDGLVLKLFGADQAAPRDLAEAFDRTFGAV